MSPCTKPRAGRPLTRALGVAAALALGSPGAFGCESCKAALASGQAGLATGINRGIYFMLAMVASVCATFAFLIWNSYRTAGRRAALASDADAVQEQS